MAVIFVTASLAVAGAVVAAPASAVPTCGGLRATIVGTDGNDRTNGTYGNDVVVLGKGSDTYFGKWGNDVVCGGPGNDILHDTRGDDRLFGGPGNDLLDGDRGNDFLQGGPGSDELNGGPGDDRLFAGPAGDDDVVVYRHSYQGVHVDLMAGTASGHGRDKVIGFEHVYGSKYDDVIRGTDRSNRIFGLHGRDRIVSLGGDDQVLLHSGIVSTGDGSDHVTLGSSGRVWTAAGDDSIRSYGGRPVLKTGAGDDRVELGGHARPWIYGGPGVDLVDARMRKVGVLIDFTDPKVGLPVSGIEAVHGTAYADILRGGDTTDEFFGRAGDDRLFGRGGNDRLYGDMDSDYAHGGAGTDTCWAERMVSCP